MRERERERERERARERERERKGNRTRDIPTNKKTDRNRESIVNVLCLCHRESSLLRG